MTAGNFKLPLTICILSLSWIESLRLFSSNLYINKNSFRLSDSSNSQYKGALVLNH